MSHILAQKQLRSIILSVSPTVLSSLCRYLQVVPLTSSPFALILLNPSRILLFFIASPFKLHYPPPSSPTHRT